MKKVDKNSKEPVLISLTVVDESISVSTPVADRPEGPQAVIPVARELANAVVAGAIRRSEASGKAISCSKGCGDCCAQLVPVSEVEALELWTIVKGWPKARRDAVQKRFSRAREQFEAAGLWEALGNPGQSSEESRKELGLRYFAQAVPCPFLEEGACSIHPQRPVICREYLVTSDPRRCSDLAAGGIDGVEIPLGVSRMMNRLLSNEPGGGAGWLPLVTLPDWISRQRGRPRRRDPREWIAALLAPLQEETRQG